MLMLYSLCSMQFCINKSELVCELAFCRLMPFIRIKLAEKNELYIYIYTHTALQNFGQYQHKSLSFFGANTLNQLEDQQ